MGRLAGFVEESQRIPRVLEVENVVAKLFQNTA